MDAGAKERQTLLVKLMLHLEKRFGNQDGVDLHRQFLETVLYVYCVPSIRTGEIAAKLEPAFHRGLTHLDPAVRKRFFRVWDASVARSPYERVWHIMCMQNWEPMHQFFWVKQCIQVRAGCRQYKQRFDRFNLFFTFS